MNQPENRSKKKREFWTDEQLYLLRIHYTDANPEKVAKMLGRTTLACVAMAGRISIKGKKPRKMTVAPWNQGKFGDALGNHKRLKPIGSTKVNADGILEQKINNGKNRQGRWKRVHVLVWEAANGPVPEGFFVTFKDGNKRNFDLSNLRLISRAENMTNNSGHSYGPEIEQLVRLRCLITRKIGKQDKQKGESDE